MLNKIVRKIKPVIMIPAYNRPDALQRLLESINNAEYPEGVNIYISLEGGVSKEVFDIALQFSPKYLRCEVIQRQNRLGLRSHILECGNMALKYGAVIVLEDDLVVDKYFYQYAIAALNYYSNENSIAGVSLYAYEYNEYANLPFKPMGNGYDTYPMRVPCSSGQAWTGTQWSNFKKWYEQNTVESVNKTLGLPNVVKDWPESSWKKYFAAYLVQNNLNFIYPYQSYSTNCSDAGGTHSLSESNIVQVSLASQLRSQPEFKFCPVTDPDIAYDSYMEPCGKSIYYSLGVDGKDIVIDMLGMKNIEEISKKYVLTSKTVLNPIRQHPMHFRPIELNISYPVHQDKAGFLSLGLRENYIANKNDRKGIDYYCYFAGYNLKTKQFFITIFIELIRLVTVKLKQRLSRALKSVFK